MRMIDPAAGVLGFSDGPATPGACSLEMTSCGSSNGGNPFSKFQL